MTATDQFCPSLSGPRGLSGQTGLTLKEPVLGAEYGGRGATQSRSRWVSESLNQEYYEVLMHQRSQRHERLRRMIRELNRDRKTQAKKVDILCHDLVDAQRSFIGRLETIRFAAAFYRSLLGQSDLTQILRTASQHIGAQVPEAVVSFFLTGSEGCKEVPYATQMPQPNRLEDLLDESVCQAICSDNRVNSLENLLALGLQVNAGVTGKYCLATIPLSSRYRPLGFIFLYKEGPHSLQAETLQQVSSVCPGFAEAISATERFPRLA